MPEDSCSVVMVTQTVTVKLYYLAVMGAVMILCLDQRPIFLQIPPLKGKGCEASNYPNVELGSFVIGLDSNGLTHLGIP
jgi:hypothetical protein